jgi:hypothetical protein
MGGASVRILSIASRTRVSAVTPVSSARAMSLASVCGSNGKMIVMVGVPSTIMPRYWALLLPCSCNAHRDRFGRYLHRLRRAAR